MSALVQAVPVVVHVITVVWLLCIAGAMTCPSGVARALALLCSALSHCYD